MRRGPAALAVFLWMFFLPFVPAASGAIFSFDAPGDVTLSATQSPGTWYTDRYAPAAFASGMTAPDGRPGTLLEIISALDSSSHRPSAFSSAFYNTQGRKHDLDPGVSHLSIDLFIPGIWDALAQTENRGRLASLWGTGLDSSHQISAYPIIEFNNNVDGASTNAFRVWNDFTGTWSVVPGFAGYDQWYTLGIDIGGGQERFFVNGNLV